jgi:hypothetical protein
MILCFHLKENYIKHIKVWMVEASSGIPKDKCKVFPHFLMQNKSCVWHLKNSVPNFKSLFGKVYSRLQYKPFIMYMYVVHVHV